MTIEFDSYGDRHEFEPVGGASVAPAPKTLPGNSFAGYVALREVRNLLTDPAETHLAVRLSRALTVIDEALSPSDESKPIPALPMDWKRLFFEEQQHRMELEALRALKGVLNKEHTFCKENGIPIKYFTDVGATLDRINQEEYPQVDVIEQCAKVCEEVSSDIDAKNKRNRVIAAAMTGALTCAAEIRALKSATPQKPKQTEPQ